MVQPMGFCLGFIWSLAEIWQILADDPDVASGCLHCTCWYVNSCVRAIHATLMQI